MAFLNHDFGIVRLTDDDFCSKLQVADEGKVLREACD